MQCSFHVGKAFLPGVIDNRCSLLRNYLLLTGELLNLFTCMNTTLIFVSNLNHPETFPNPSSCCASSIQIMSYVYAGSSEVQEVSDFTLSK